METYVIDVAHDSIRHLIDINRINGAQDVVYIVYIEADGEMFLHSVLQTLNTVSYQCLKITSIYTCTNNILL